MSKKIPTGANFADLLLTEDDNRYVMFPLKDNDIWKMYKKQVDCFWRPEEIDLTIDNCWSDILWHESHVNREQGLSRHIFAVRNNVCRGPLMIDHNDMIKMNYFDEIYKDSKYLKLDYDEEL